MLALAQSSVPPDRQPVLDRIRQAATTYTDQLQDFTCTQTTIRSGANASNPAKWKTVDTQENELNFVGHKEHYRLLKVNGDSSRPEARVAKGYTRTSGEFGSLLKSVFRPESQADFEWSRAEGGQCVFNYRIDVQNSTMTMTTGKKRRALAFGGTVYGDCESGKVARITAVSRDDGSDEALTADVRYAPTRIGDREFLLPTAAENIARHGRTLTKAEITFTNYRKYDSATTLKFDEDPAPPDGGK